MADYILGLVTVLFLFLGIAIVVRLILFINTKEYVKYQKQYNDFVRYRDVAHNRVNNRQNSGRVVLAVNAIVQLVLIILFAFASIGAVATAGIALYRVFLVQDSLPRIPERATTEVAIETPTVASTPNPESTAPPARIACNEQRTPVEVAIVFDRSGSMEGGNMEIAQEIATNILSALEHGQDRVALIGLESQAELIQPLTSDQNLLTEALRSITPAGGTDIAAGIRLARSELEGVNRSPDALPIIIIISDGGANEIEPAISEVEQANASGIRVITVRVGPEGAAEVDLFTRLASQPDESFSIRTSTELASVSEQIGRRLYCNQDIFVPSRDTNSLPPLSPPTTGGEFIEPTPSAQTP